MLFMVPFAVLLMMQMIGLKNDKWLQLIKYVAIVLVLVVSLYKIYYNRVYKLYISRNIRQEQMSITKEVNRHLSDGSLWVVHGGLYYLYLTTGAMPPNLSTIGYNFGPLGLDEDKAFAQAKAADNVVRFSADYSHEAFFTDRVKRFIEQYQVSPVQDSCVLVYDMHHLAGLQE